MTWEFRKHYRGTENNAAEPDHVMTCARRLQQLSKTKADRRDPTRNRENCKIELVKETESNSEPSEENITRLCHPPPKDEKIQAEHSTEEAWNGRSPIPDRHEKVTRIESEQEAGKDRRARPEPT
jgi:hypothetical protein